MARETLHNGPEERTDKRRDERTHTSKHAEVSNVHSEHKGRVDSRERRVDNFNPRGTYMDNPDWRAAQVDRRGERGRGTGERSYVPREHSRRQAGRHHVSAQTRNPRIIPVIFITKNIFSG